jgi:uncharacterized repeat protein (TIGR02059 family)
MAAFHYRANWFGWGDYLPPVPTAAKAVNAAALTIGFDTALTANSPTASQFTVLVNGASRGVSSAAASGSTVTLTLASAVTNGQTVTVQYTPGGAIPIRDAAANVVAAFGPSPVTNNTP